MSYRQNIAILGLFTSYNIETARVIADDYDLHFLDSNQFLEYNMTYRVDEILNDFGEDYLLKCEEKAYKELSEFDKSVIGTSATALLNKNNVLNLKKNCYVILLMARKVNTNKRRLRNDNNIYLKENLTNDINSIIEFANQEIAPICDLVVEIDGLSPVRAGRKCEDALSELLLESQEA